MLRTGGHLWLGTAGSRPVYGREDQGEEEVPPVGERWGSDGVFWGHSTHGQGTWPETVYTHVRREGTAASREASPSLSQH